MRVSYEGDYVEAMRWLGKAQQELVRLKQRMATQGNTDGSFAMSVSPTVFVRGHVLPTGLESIHIRATVTQGGTSTGKYFEFMTSGVPVTLGTVHQEAIDFEAYFSTAIGVSIGVTNGVVDFLPRIVKPRQLGAAGVSPLGRSAQVNLFDEPVAYPSKDRTLYESWAPGHPHTGVYTTAYQFQTAGYYDNRGPFATHYLRDIGLDVPFQYGDGTAKVKTAYIRGDADWPRATAIQKAHGRTFAISIDAFSQVSVFPLGAIQALTGYTQNVDASVVKAATVVFPSWVYRPTQTLSSWFAAHGTTGLTNFPDLDWKTHPDGTKMCAVVYERAAATFDSAYFAVDQGSAPRTEAAWNTYRDSTGVAGRHSAVGPVGQRYNVAPGLLEVSIVIDVTGPGEGDFTVTLNTTELRRPTTTPYFTMLAGYVWSDIGTTKRGDLASIDIELWHQTSGAAGHHGFMSLKNLTRGTELRTFDARNLVAADMKTLSFVVMVVDTEVVSRTLNGRTGATPPTFAFDYNITHFALNVFTLNQQREMLFPATMPPARKAALSARKATQPRTQLTGLGWGLLPLNELRTWSDPEFGNLRDYFATNITFQKNLPSATLPSADLRDYLAGWGFFAFAGVSFLSTLTDITDPRMGWNGYAYDFLNRLAITPYTTFFAHENGTWALYDQQYVYNSYGLNRLGTSQYDSLTPFDVASLEHCVFDRVHFTATSKGKTLSTDTSFTDLYNAAAKGVADFERLVNPRATFTKVVYADPGGHLENLQLKVDWYPRFSGYYFEPGYERGDPFYDRTGGGGLADLSLGDLFYTGVNLTGDYVSAQLANVPVTFSSCVMIP